MNRSTGIVRQRPVGEFTTIGTGVDDGGGGGVSWCSSSRNGEEWVDLRYFLRQNQHISVTDGEMTGGGIDFKIGSKWKFENIFLS